MRETTAPEAGSSASLLALAEQCVQCGLCLPHCPTYRLDATESESPRGRIAYMRALAGGQMAPTEVGDRHLDHCLGCRRCESACPAGVRYEALLTGTRAAQAGRQAKAGTTRVALALLARPGLLDPLLGTYRRLFPLLPASLRRLPRPPSASPGAEPSGSSTGGSAPAPMSAPMSLPLPLPTPVPTPVPLPEPLPEPGPREAAIFIGCISKTYEAPARASLLRLLAAAGVAVLPAEGQACCGAAALHAGDAAQAQSLAARNRAAFAGSPVVLSLASGCQASLASSLAGQSPVLDACAFLEERADCLRFRSARGRRVALHLPCTQRVSHGEAALRRLLAHVPDLDLVELPDSGCCGAAGLHMVEEPERAAALRAPVLQSLANCGATELLSANIGCRLHLANASDLPIRHPLEFLAEHLA